MSAERVSIPGVESLRSQLDIEPDDPAVFRPILAEEALRVARVILRDETIPSRMRKVGVVGIMLDLLPGHLRPSPPVACAMVGIHRETFTAWEIEWESSCPEDLRFNLVQRAYRMILAERAAAR